ncbi:MAG: NADH-quinone oxidoreductase subunit NuoK [Gammaproteobacteria bacterium]|nr:MAG: NADH-quinone oxidoreductase subunit NuoK [Gammaproteobacteria bacterium]
MIDLKDVLVLSSILFTFGIAGVIMHRRNLVRLLMCVELILLAVNINFVAFSNSMADISGQVFVFFILTIAAAESAVGLALIITLYREHKTVDLDKLTELRE